MSIGGHLDQATCPDVAGKLHRTHSNGYVEVCRIVLQTSTQTNETDHCLDFGIELRHKTRGQQNRESNAVGIPHKFSKILNNFLNVKFLADAVDDFVAEVNRSSVILLCCVIKIDKVRLGTLCRHLSGIE